MKGERLLCIGLLRVPGMLALKSCGCCCRRSHPKTSIPLASSTAVVDGAWLPVPVAGVMVGVVEAVVSDPVGAVVVAVVLAAVDSVGVDVVEFALAAARLRRCV